ncbi:MAG: hypothetical protein IIX76_06140, partial [Bacteroidales bacterium]|nr:hypothetical protein [Bacteroidales bacterium]
MKSIKFSLAVLMLAAAFTACTKDEMVSSQVDPMQKELVGAELLGTNISVNFGQDTDTKLYGSTWADTDLLGLGWVVKGNYGDIQDGTEPDNSRLAANHMFAKGENGFTTKGNVYKGWHFAYFPFKYEEQVFVEKTIDNMNPVQTEVYDTDRYNTAFYISAKEFLTAEDHLTKDNQLENVTFDLFRAFKTIGVTVKPDASIKSDDVLKTLAIKSVTIRTADKKPFAVGGFTLKPNLLASMAYDEDGEYDKAATK